MNKTLAIIAALLIVATGYVHAEDGAVDHSDGILNGSEPSLGVPPPMPAFATGDTIFSEDWEWGQGFWTIGLNSCWQIGVTSGSSPAVFQGDYCAGTTLAGYHPETSSGYLRRNGIALPALDSLDEKIVLWFAQWVNCYNDRDYGSVRVDAGDGMVEIGPRQWRRTSGWSWTAVDITAYAGTTIDLGFYFYALDQFSGTDSREGWYIDDILILKGVIPAPRVPHDFDFGQQDWYATHGNWFVQQPTAGPGSSYRGTQCLSYVPWGIHPEDTASYFVSPTWYIPDLGTGAAVDLNYHVWLDTYNDRDYYQVEASIDGNAWTLIDGPYHGNSQGWVPRSASIVGCNDCDLQIRFYYRGVDQYSGTDSRFGVAIDHIYFKGLGLLAHDTSPYAQSYAVPLDSNIRIDFSNPVNTSTINASSFQVTGSASGPISGSFSFSPDGLAFIFNPHTDYAEDEIITCRLTDAVRDLHGLALDGDGDLYPGGDLVWEFCTFDHPCDVAPPVPTNLVASVDGNTVSLAWQIASGSTIEEFRIYRGVTPGEWTQLGSVAAGTLTYNDPTGTAGTQYFYAVTSYSLNGRESQHSNQVCATPGDTQPPAQPAGLQATAGSGAVTLTWQSNTECDLVSYRIIRTPEGGEPAQIATVSAVSGPTVSYTDATVQNHVEYCYQVRAVDNAGLASALSASACATVVGPVADLELAMELDVANADSVSVNDTVTFLLTVTNHGPDTAAEVLAVNTLPAGLGFVSAVPSQGEFGALTGEWLIGQLASGAEASLALSAVVNVPGDTLINTATVSDMQSSDPAPEDNTASAWVVGLACDLEVVKSADNLYPNVGDEVVFKVRVTNHGPHAAAGVVVHDALPGQLTYRAVIKSAGIYIGDTWRLGTMEPGRIDSMLIYGTVMQAVSITNTATVSAVFPADLDHENDISTVTLLGQSTDLALTMAASPLGPQEGDPVTFTVTVRNHGPSTATGVVVSAPVPAGLSAVDVSEPAGTEYAEGIWTVGTVNIGQTLTLTIEAEMGSDDPVVYCAEIESSDQADPNPNNDMACVTVSSQQVDLALTKSVDVAQPALGDTVNFRVILQNDSAINGTGIRVLDRAAPGLVFVAVDVTSGAYDMGTGIWSVPLLANGDQDTLSIAARIDQPITITNTATLVGADQADPVPDNNTASVVITGQAADLAVTKTLDNFEPAVGEIVTFEVKVKNNGPSATTGVRVHDLLPASELAYESHTQTGVSYSTTTGEWHVGDLAIGDAHAKTLTLHARVLTANPFVNTAQITASDLPDPREDNNWAQVGGLLRYSDLALTKTVSDHTPAVYTDVSYTLTLSNLGPDDTSEVVVRDVLPRGVSYVSHTASRGEYADWLWTVDSLPYGSSEALTITVTVDAMGEILNQAEIIGQRGIDRNLHNNSAVADMHPVNPPPVIVITGYSSASVGAPITVTATVTDNVGVMDGSVQLHYRTSALGSYVSVPMSAAGAADTYEGVIPGEVVTARGVDCYVSARDLDGQLGESAHGMLAVRVTLAQNPSSQPAGGQQSAYRMVSIPLNLDDKRPGAVFEPVFGTYDPSQWKLFGLNVSQSWENSQFPNCGNAVAGRGYFLIAREAGKHLSAGPGLTVPTGQPYVINLHAGWNLIGNPYNFTVPMSALSLESGAALDVRNFIGSWAQLSPGSSLEPWHGYLVASNIENDRLLIDPIGASGKVLPAEALPQPVWAINIAARIGDALDDDNWAAVYEGASDEWDILDRPEPLAIGDYVSVSFPHPDWDTPFSSYSKDARPATCEAEGWTWDLQVRTNLAGRVELTFKGLESLPADREIWLRDELLSINIDLRETAEYTFVGASSGSPRALQLVVGDPEYIEKALPADESIPRVVTLSANFPNPFNPLTTIRYGLPHAGRVVLCVYDVRGRLVKELVNEDRPAGYHAVVWESDDQAGRRVASGVYLYRLVADDVVKTQKMLLVK